MIVDFLHLAREGTRQEGALVSRVSAAENWVSVAPNWLGAATVARSVVFIPLRHCAASITGRQHFGRRSLVPFFWKIIFLHFLLRPPPHSTRYWFDSCSNEERFFFESLIGNLRYDCFGWTTNDFCNVSSVTDPVELVLTLVLSHGGTTERFLDNNGVFLSFLFNSGRSYQLNKTIKKWIPRRVATAA